MMLILTLKPDPNPNPNHNPNSTYPNKPIEPYQTVLTLTSTLGLQCVPEIDILCTDDRFARSGDCTALSADCAVHSTDPPIAQRSVDCITIGRSCNSRLIAQ